MKILFVGVVVLLSTGCIVCPLTDDNESGEVNCDSMFGIYRAPYEKPTPLCCIEPLYQLNDDGSVPGYPDLSASLGVLLNKLQNI